MLNSIGKFFICFVLLVWLCHVSSTIPMPDMEFSLARGYGSHLNWTTLDDAFRQSILSRKPIMLLIHQKWCKACRELMPKFRENPYITKLAPFFEMVNVMDEEEPKDPQFSPDGLYYPRILFISPDGLVHTEINNPESAHQYLYYYYEADSAVAYPCFRHFAHNCKEGLSIRRRMEESLDTLILALNTECLQKEFKSYCRRDN